MLQGAYESEAHFPYPTSILESPPPSIPPSKFIAPSHSVYENGVEHLEALPAVTLHHWMVKNGKEVCTLLVSDIGQTPVIMDMVLLIDVDRDTNKHNT